MADLALDTASISSAHNRCAHTGYYSGIGVYARESQILRYVLVCDDCGGEMKQISAVDYVPSPVLAAA
jgi:hypothetical protein